MHDTTTSEAHHIHPYVCSKESVEVCHVGQSQIIKQTLYSNPVTYITFYLYVSVCYRLHTCNTKGYVNTYMHNFINLDTSTVNSNNGITVWHKNVMVIIFFGLSLNHLDEKLTDEKLMYLILWKSSLVLKVMVIYT